VVHSLSIFPFLTSGWWPRRGWHARPASKTRALVEVVTKVVGCGTTSLLCLPPFTGTATQRSPGFVLFRILDVFQALPRAGAVRVVCPEDGGIIDGRPRPHWPAISRNPLLLRAAGPNLALLSGLWTVKCASVGDLSVLAEIPRRSQRARSRPLALGHERARTSRQAAGGWAKSDKTIPAPSVKEADTPPCRAAFMLNPPSATPIPVPGRERSVVDLQPGRARPTEDGPTTREAAGRRHLVDFPAFYFRRLPSIATNPALIGGELKWPGVRALFSGA
jgi:hypothetical protein